MASRQKISQMTPKGANLAATDLLEISELSGSGYITKSITGQEIIDASGGNFVPYTGATADVDLGTFHLDAGKGTFSHSGSTDTLTATHSSGSGIGLSITKGGSNEGLKVNKTSGSGNAATIIGTLEATTLVKTGGLSTQFLMADGTTSLGGGGGITVGTTAVTSGTIGRIFFEGTGNVVQQSASLFWDNTNSRLGVGATPASTVRLDVRAQGALSTDIAFRVRNSADTADILTVRGDSFIGVNSAPITMQSATSHTIKSSTTAGDRGLLAVIDGNNIVKLGVGTNGVGLGLAPIADLALNCDNAATNAFQFKVGGVMKFQHNKSFGFDLYAINRSITVGTYEADATLNITATTSKAHLKLNAITAPTGTHLNNGVMWYQTNNFGFRVNGATVKLYQETTAVVAAAFVSNTSLIVDDSATYGGYTMGQVVAALKAQGLLA